MGRLSGRRLKVHYVAAAVLAAGALASLAASVALTAANEAAQAKAGKKKGKKPDISGLKAGPVQVSTSRIDYFQSTDTARKRFGRLEFLGGLVLTSPAREFGGWSDIAIDRDGAGLLAVSDGGVWLRGTLKYLGTKPLGLTQTKLGPLRALSGRLLKGKKERDAEGLVLKSGSLKNGDLLISFERIHRIGHFKVNGSGVVGPSAYIKLPKKARRLRRNKGLEALAILRGGPLKGAVVALAERRRSGKGNRFGWVLTGGKSFRFKLKDIGNLDITSAASLPGGGLLILERRFRWSEGVSMRLRLIKSSELRPGALITGEILLTAGLGSNIDNMEGMAVHAGPGGMPIITLMSDDNFNRFLQRNILLQFALHD